MSATRQARRYMRRISNIREKMSERIVELTLPEFAFLEGSGHVRPDILRGRNVIYHTRTASVVEVLEWKMSAIKPEKMQQRFVYRNRYGLEEQMIIVLHYSATLDEVEDREEIFERVIKPAIKWYCDYCDWEDGNGGHLWQQLT